MLRETQGAAGSKGDPIEVGAHMLTDDGFAVLQVSPTEFEVVDTGQTLTLV